MNILPQDKKGRILIIIFILLTAWWIYILKFTSGRQNDDLRQLYAASYQILAFLGGIIGIFISRYWGGTRSIVGKAVMAFSIGMLLQVFGQSAYSFYIYYLQVDIPYPSIGDIGFFGTIPFYFLGGLLLTELSGVKSKLQSLGYKLFLILIPFVVLMAQYFLILKDYVFDWNNKIKIFLDLGYPMGDAMIISIAILALLLSINAVGGIMKKPIMYLVFALFIQYFADIYFFYQANHGTYNVGGPADFFYSFSYLFMALAILSMGEAYRHIKAS